MSEEGGLRLTLPQCTGVGKENRSAHQALPFIVTSAKGSADGEPEPCLSARVCWVMVHFRAENHCSSFWLSRGAGSPDVLNVLEARRGDRLGGSFEVK